MIIDHIEIKKNEKKHFSIEIEGGHSLKGIAICGDGTVEKTLVICAGVHGCEYVGIEALIRLSRSLLPTDLEGNIILLPLINETGFFTGLKQVVAYDGKNLNREFPGDASGSYTSRLAHAIETHIYPHASFLIDMHGGDMHESLAPLIFFPVASGKEIENITREAASKMTIPLRVQSRAGNGLYSYATKCGIPAMLYEKGCCGIWREEEVVSEIEDLYILMRHMGILKGTYKHPKTNMAQKEISKASYIETDMDAMWYPYVKVGERVKADALLGKVMDTAGNFIREVRAEYDAIILYYIESLGVMAGDTLIAYGSTHGEE